MAAVADIVAAVAAAAAAAEIAVGVVEAAKNIKKIHTLK